ncbi:MAG: response regulator [Endomicrobiaceae bacterium]|nr:response regulator [Endomicrobiaceae bacterium]
MAFTILVVDDEVLLREMLKDIFTIAGYNVITAENGKEGLEKIEQFLPDFVILDGSMPVMDGFETLEQIRKNPKFINLPVMMFTALSGESEQIKGLSLGADDYITKPFKTPILLTKVKNILDRKRKSMEVNPLTSLPGNLSIQENIEKRIANKTYFSLLYIDLNNFKSFNDKYGFYVGDKIIKFTADLLQDIIKKYGMLSDFVGHIGGDDFVIITESGNSITLAENIIDEFDKGVKQFYNEEDRKNGFIVSTDRNDNIQKFPIMTISIAIISTDVAHLTHFAEISKRASELKKLAKKNNKSSYVFERRKDCR